MAKNDGAPATPTQQKMAAAINALLERGFEEDGKTQGERYRIVTQDSYPLAGAEINTGGRLRFTLPGTRLKVTVGARTVYGYRVLTDKEFRAKRDAAKFKALVDKVESVGRPAKTKELGNVCALADAMLSQRDKDAS